MKKLVAVVALTVALVFAGTASAHTSAFTANVVCNQTTGEYDVTWVVGPTSDIGKAPVISASNNAAIPVDSPLAALTQFKQSVPGNTGYLTSTITIKWNDDFTQVRTASVEMPGNCAPPKVRDCPAGYTNGGETDGVLLCTKETITTITTPPITVIEYRDVPGPTVEKIVTTYVDRPIPGKTVIKIVKIKGKTKYVYKTVYKCKPKPKPCAPGLVLYKGHCAVPGSG